MDDEIHIPLRAFTGERGPHAFLPSGAGGYWCAICGWSKRRHTARPALPAHAHEWHPAGFTPHPRSGGLMPTERCACGAVRYPFSPDVPGGDAPRAGGAGTGGGGDG
jgi:hypothetical protein